MKYIWIVNLNSGKLISMNKLICVGPLNDNGKEYYGKEFDYIADFGEKSLLPLTKEEYSELTRAIARHYE